MRVLDIRPLHHLFCAEVHGVDFNAPLDPPLIEAIKAAWIEHKVLIFPNQALSDAQHVAFSRTLGDLEDFPMQSVRSGAHSEIFRVANTDDKGTKLPTTDDRVRYLKVTQVWHNDSSYRKNPSVGAILHGVEVPRRGGETWFVDMVKVYEDLPSDLRSRVAGKRAIHSFEYSRTQVGPLVPLSAEEKAKVPPVEHPLVRIHPRSKKPTLFLSPIYIQNVIGLSDEASTALLTELREFALQDKYMYRHRWFPHDLMMWDNCAVMHAGQPFDDKADRRVMHRTTFVGEPVIPADE